MKRSRTEAEDEGPKTEQREDSSPGGAREQKDDESGRSDDFRYSKELSEPVPDSEAEEEPSSQLESEAQEKSGSLVELDDQPQQYVDGFVTSSYFGPLPGKNPFWKDTSKNQQATRYDLKHRLNPHRRPPPLIQLGQTNLTEEVRDQSQALRRFAQRVFFRNLKISDPDMGNNTMASKLRSDTQLYSQWTRGIVNWQKDYQNKMLEFIKVGMITCMMSLGGTKKWASSTMQQRAVVYNAYWNQDGKYMTSLFFRPVIEGIDLDGIFATTESERRRWQRYVKTIFMWVCDDTYKLRLVGNTPLKVTVTMASNFRQMAWCSEMMELDLGDVDNVPVSLGAPPSQNKRARLQPMVGERRVLADI